MRGYVRPATALPIGLRYADDRAQDKILVVDDDLRLRDLLQRYLTEQGFGVHTVPDAAAWTSCSGASASICWCST